jgi:ABC-2 type transport system ATP-binding protein
MIEAVGIRKKYKKQVLQDVSFKAEKGECVGILGANGCGKTTLLSIMAGVRKADGGKLFYNGENAFESRRVFKRYAGYVPQENPLIGELSARDNLRLWYGRTAFNSALNGGIIKRLGIDEYLNKRVDKLSGGMKRRLSIAIALADNAPVLIMDEPGAALDIYGKEEIRNYIGAFAKSGGTVIMSTHDETEIQMCDTLYIMENGILRKC